MQKIVPPATLLAWLRDAAFHAAWRQLAHNLNRIPMVLQDEPLGPNLKDIIKSTCERGVKVFEDVREDRQEAA
jgi:hypothetical protein